MMLQEQLKKTAQKLKEDTGTSPAIGFILGSGLSDFGQNIEAAKTYSYQDVPGLLSTSVEGHPGKLILGKFADRDVVVFQGRFHAYEGHSLEQVTATVRLAGYLGVKTIMLTNASGGINEAYRAGDLVLMTDQINLSGMNALIGPNDQTLGPRFPDMTQAFCPKLQKILIAAAKEHQYNLKSGVYVGVSGPCYETPAEIKMMRLLGGDLVGMSTVQEVIVANHMGLQVAGISCVANLAAGMTGDKLDHQEIKQQVEASLGPMKEIFASFTKALD